ncbi:MBL fold metallo-hydrolase [Micromonospora globbae]|uniref:MBL fold metallo-hydrolase n=1 Tax=Micromonospora globbae TaxID=1894969 RepID=A0A420EZY2_9ACTN|nr:MBL fold metallo-hydrolase [Micromonospora globbae]RKF26315.1 MBL fold metallo-hydrolase [Micromonospora globbae]
MRSQSTQAPGFQRFRIGSRLVTALYDGYVPILAADLRGAPREQVRARLADAHLPEDGDPYTAVIAFLVEEDGRHVLVDTGSGSTLGPDTGHLLDSLSADGVTPDEIAHILITHLHPDHSGGLVTADGEAVYPRATVHVARDDVAYWLDPQRAARAEGVQREIHEAALASLAPYRRTGRLDAFHTSEVLPGVRALDQHGHTAGHTGYLFGEGPEAVLFWGDTVHSHAVQLPHPQVSIAIDNAPDLAVRARGTVFDLVTAHRWWVAAAHLPFPGLGHLRRTDEGYAWVPAHFRPLPAVG